MPDEIVNLSDVQDPVFKFKLRNGEERAVDPFEVQERLAAQQNGEPVFENIRFAFGLATETAAQAASDPKPYVASRHECLYLTQKLHEFCEGLEVTKKLSGLTAKWRASTASSHANG